jgi:beta-glucosidase-like glycosyl hydrolase/CubicO group peptidase (beta-lactamase class C family)
MRRDRIIIFLFVFLFSVEGIFAINPILISQFPKKNELKLWVDSLISTLTLDEQIGQLFMITADVSLNESNVNKLSSYVQNQKIGGLLFAKSTIETQAKLTNLLQAKARIPMFISLDGEWGLSMRIDGTTRFPKNIALGALKDTHLIYDYGREVARQCKLMGIQINFAPVLDINNNPNNPVINIRSFGENRERVTSAALAYAKGLENGGVIAVGKHFPGHGDTSLDSHFNLPTLNLSLSRLDSLELYPFKKYINSGFSGMMVGHLFLPAFDQDTVPASLSQRVIGDLLKTELGFEGLTFTDALVMKAIIPVGKSVSVKALLAGNDILLNPANPVSEIDSVKQAIELGILSAKSIEAKCRKVLSYKYICGLNNYNPIEISGLMNRLNTRDGELLNRKLAEKSLSLLKNSNEIIPIKGLDTQKIAMVSIGEKYTSFQSTSLLYANATSFSITESSSIEQVSQISKSLNDFSLILIGIYSDKNDLVEKTKELLSSLNGKQKIVTSFFVSPYKMIAFKKLVSESNGVLMAYENTPLTQQFASQLIFGGVGSQGKLSVTVDSLFANGIGYTTQKCRLGYNLPEAVGLDSRKLIQIDTLVREAIAAQAIPGCQVLVAKNGVVVYQKSFGFFDYAGTHPVSNYDLYDLASVTKAAATVPALMVLYDKNKFLLRDRLGDFIPEIKNTEKGDITVKDALYHQSGLPAFIPFSQMLIDPASYVGALVSTQKNKLYSQQIDESLFTQKYLKFKTDFVSDKDTFIYTVKVADHFYLNPNFYPVMMQRLLLSKLGSKDKYVYSDLNFMLLRKMVENQATMRIDSFLQKNIYLKLGAYSTGYLPLTKFDRLQIAPTENDQFFRNQLLIGYPHDELAALAGGVEGNAGLFSNANDLAKLCQLYLDEGKYGGETLINNETVRMFTQSKSPDSRRGLGFDKPNPVRPSQGPISDMAPLSTYGHTGFTGTCFWVDPDNQLIYIFLSNRVYPNRWNKKLNTMDTRTLIQEAIYKAFIQNKN